MKPVLDRIIIEQDPAPSTMGGFAISDTAKERPREGTVIAVGPGVFGPQGQVLPMMTRVGDKVVYGEYAGQAIQRDGKEYIILKEGDLLLVL